MVTIMYSKTLLVFLVYLLSDFSYGQRDKKFFRKDYSLIEKLEGFYKIHTSQRTWADAKRVCAQEGASLFYPKNSNEVHVVISFWNRTQPTIEWAFVGLSDILSEGVFETIDGKSVSEVYNHWQRGEPNNEDDEDCVHLNLQGELNDVPCDGKSYFICKKSLQTLEWNYKCNMSNLGYTLREDIGKCYKLHTTPLSWSEAYAECRAEQSYLAVITNQLEADYLAEITGSASKQRVKENYQRGIYHLGFHNRFHDGWQTVRGTPVNADVNAWWENYQPHNDDLEECGSMFYTGRLNIINCDTKSFFICEHADVCSNSSDDDVKCQSV